jgi:hypothetical protein
MKKYLFFMLSVSIMCFAQNTGARYLIITHDSYYPYLQTLAEWKTQKGLKAKLVTLSEIGGSDSASIRDYIVNAYNTWDIKPEYLLIVGNSSQIKLPRLSMSPHYVYSDNFYTNITGDFHNEIIPGRIWVYDTNQIKTVIAKILSYDKNPFIQDTLWIRKGTTLVVEDNQPPYSDSTYWADTWFTQQLMLNAGFVHIDTFALSLGDSSMGVINAINDGRSYIQYRNQGEYQWHPPFDNIDTSLMANGSKLPIIISGTCNTVEGLGWLWMAAGSPEQFKGSVGFFGTHTSESGAAEFRSALVRGSMRSIFTDSFSTLGNACEAGRLNYSTIFNDSLGYRSWTCLGDPEMSVRTANPRIIQVSHSPTIWFADTLTVQVKCGSIPVESALVCVMSCLDTSKYYYGRTDNLGYIKFPDSLHYPDTALITVTGRNIKPAMDSVLGGSHDGPSVRYMSHYVLDSIGGNGNHIPNNGENIELMVWVRNFGDSTAHGVTGIIQKAETDAYYQLSDTIKSFGDIASIDSASTTADGYNISIVPDCPDSHFLKLKLTVQDAANTAWISYFNILVYSPRPYVVYKSYLILDSLGGNNNRQVNPAENIELPVWLKNIGDSMAIGVTGTIQKVESDPYLFISDTIKNYGTILPADSAWTGLDGYNIYADSQCPDQHELKLRVRIRDSLDSIWTYDFNLINHAPVLVFNDYLIDDSIKYIRHGDTAQLALYIKNTGSFMAENVAGHMISSDTFLIVQYADATFGTILPGGIGDNATNQFIIRARPDAPPGYSADLRLALLTGSYRDTIDFSVYIGQRDYLVWDPDPNHSSGFVIHQKLMSLNYLGDYRQTAPYDYLNVYKVTFISAGIATNNFVIADTNPIVPEILHYYDAGGKLYMEGGNVWFHDTTIGGYNFCPLFHILAIQDAGPTYTGVIGYPNTFTRDMSFRYTGESQSIDRINPDSIGVAILKHRTLNYNCGVAANHKTVGISIEFGGLVDSIAPSTKLILADSIMRYFGITPSGWISENETIDQISSRVFLELFPNPFTKNINIRYGCGSDINSKKSRIRIFDVTGRFIKEISIYPQGFQSNVIWRGDDTTGRKTAAGIYFICLEAGGDIITKKIILLK